MQTVRLLRRHSKFVIKIKTGTQVLFYVGSLTAASVLRDFLSLEI